MRWINAVVAVAMLLVVPASVKAAEVPSEQAVLTLDQGFVGRPVSLDLFHGAVTLSWDAKSLIAPTTLRVSRAPSVTSTEQVVAADAVVVDFADPAAISPRGTFRVRVKALRPPTATEAPEANIVHAGTSTIVRVPGTFARDSITFALPAHPSFQASPTYRDGMMRAGQASWYAYKKCLCAASPDVPKGTRLIVRRADNPARFVIVTVNDWGPERDKFPERVIDLDKVAFARIGNPRGGVMGVTVDVVPPGDPLWKLADELPPPNWKKLWAALLKKSVPTVIPNPPAGGEGTLKTNP